MWREEDYRSNRTFGIEQVYIRRKIETRNDEFEYAVRIDADGDVELETFDGKHSTGNDTWTISPARVNSIFEKCSGLIEHCRKSGIKTPASIRSVDPVITRPVLTRKRTRSSFFITVSLFDGSRLTDRVMDNEPYEYLWRNYLTSLADLIADESNISRHNDQEKSNRLREYAFNYIDFHPDNVNPKFIVCARNKQEAIRLSPLGKKSDEYPEFVTHYRKYRWEIEDITWFVPRTNLRKKDKPRIISELPGLKKPSGRRS